ncbi:RHS repeat-associated core domain-containing protein [Pseudomonas sp. Z1-14]|uniref:RHS repeat-associated core domain-containing protein n=1 Tax=Pseudomonas sp. Z1-14 TaxID=2817409 RepID=UPI003DA7B1B0
MPSIDETLLCRYHYDPLDRLADCTPAAQASTQRFYLQNRLSSEIQGSVQRSVFQHDDQLLAQQQCQNEVRETYLLATDQRRSVLKGLDATQPHSLAYTAYGHGSENGLLSLLGFNGERPDPVTGHYLLGNGYRAFNPVLMRFHSPDNLSPFGKGGLNAYAYCLGDPVNKTDPTGHFPNLWKALLNVLNLRISSTRLAAASSQATVFYQDTATSRATVFYPATATSRATVFYQATATSRATAGYAANAVTPRNIATATPPPSYSAGNLNRLRPPSQRGEPPAYRSLPPGYNDHGLDPLILATEKEYQNGGPPTYPEAEGRPWLFMSPSTRRAFLRYARSSTSSSISLSAEQVDRIRRLS